MKIVKTAREKIEHKEKTEKKEKRIMRVWKYSASENVVFRLLSFFFKHSSALIGALGCR